MTDSVKIDKQLLERVKKLIKNDSKRIKYSSAKQFVNISVLELLERELNEENSSKRGQIRELSKK